MLSLSSKAFQKQIKRNLEKFSVFFVYNILPFIIIVCCILCIPLMFTYAFWIPMGYYVWCLYDGNTPYQAHNSFQSLIRSHAIWYYFVRYFPIRLNFQHYEQFDPEHSYLLINHTFGYQNIAIKTVIGTEALNWSKKFPYFTSYVSVLPIFFYLPFVRDFCLALGFINDKNETLSAVLHNPSTIVALSVNGSKQNFTYKIPIKYRKDFIKTALHNGTFLVPVLTFGENKLYKSIQLTSKIMSFRIINFFMAPFFRFRFRFNFYYGSNYLFPIGFLPFRTPIHIIVGNPIKVPKIQNPNQEDVNKYHEIYLTETEKLFQEQKEKFTNSDKGELKFI